MPRVLPEEFSLMSCVIRHDKVPLYPGPRREETEETETYSMMLYHNNYENVLYKLYKYQYCISHIRKHFIMDANWVFTMPHLSVGRQVKLKETWPKPFLVGGFNPSEKNGEIGSFPQGWRWKKYLKPPLDNLTSLLTNGPRIGASGARTRVQASPCPIICLIWRLYLFHI